MIQLKVARALIGLSLKVVYGKHVHVSGFAVQAVRTVSRKVMNEYVPSGKFLGTVVLVGDEDDGAVSEELEDWPDDWPAGIALPVAAACADEVALFDCSFLKPTTSPSTIATIDINSRRTKTKTLFQPPLLPRMPLSRLDPLEDEASFSAIM